MSRVKYLLLLVPRQRATVDHVVEGDVSDLLEAAGRHVEAHRPVEEKRPQLEERVEGEGGHVGFTPPVPSLFNILFELDPSGRTRLMGIFSINFHMTFPNSSSSNFSPPTWPSPSTPCCRPPPHTAPPSLRTQGGSGAPRPELASVSYIKVYN